ncbi:MAG TPA: hypothetical protein QF900_08925, partial [Arenicellales bacterium]|nr:hypothetical protein [Arenicellales bacterium]
MKDAEPGPNKWARMLFAWLGLGANNTVVILGLFAKRSSLEAFVQEYLLDGNYQTWGTALAVELFLLAISLGVWHGYPR